MCNESNEIKVGILTWYKALNHGAVLQTYASCQMLKELNASPVVLDFNWNQYRHKRPLEKYKRWLKKMSVNNVILHFKVKRFDEEKRQKFQRFNLEYLPIGKNYLSETAMYAVYIGSDMVFDIVEGYNPYMYGKNVPAPYKFSYAASFGYTDFEKLEKSGKAMEVANYLNQMDQIGYRDQNTVDLCKRLSIRTPMEENVDPVLAYGFEKEIQSWDTGKWKDRKYVLIYSYHNTMNDSHTVSSIQKLAKDHNLPIICCGYYHKWCDECISASPNEFLEMFKYAAYVVTDTFHGTVFSLLLHKNFSVIILKNGFKVRHLLNQTNLECRIAEKGDSIESILCSAPDYAEFDSWLKAEQGKSRAYISRNLSAAREKNETSYLL